MRSFGSGTGGEPNFTTQCTCGAELETPDIEKHNDFQRVHTLCYPSTAHVSSEDWDEWIRMADMQGHGALHEE